jgi:hypothetical protein
MAMGGAVLGVPVMSFEGKSMVGFSARKEEGGCRKTGSRKGLIHDGVPAITVIVDGG